MTLGLKSGEMLVIRSYILPVHGGLHITYIYLDSLSWGKAHPPYAGWHSETSTEELSQVVHREVFTCILLFSTDADRDPHFLPDLSHFGQFGEVERKGAGRGEGRGVHSPYAIQCGILIAQWLRRAPQGYGMYCP